MKENTMVMERENEEMDERLKRLLDEEEKKDRKTRRKRHAYRIIDRNTEGIYHDRYELEGGYEWIFPDYIVDYLEEQNRYDEEILSTYTDFSRDDSEREVYEYNEDEYNQGYVPDDYRNDCTDEDGEEYYDED